MRYGDIANELNTIAQQLTELADNLQKIEAAMPDISIPTEIAQKKEVLSITELAEALSISRSTAFQLAHRDDFPSIRIGKRILIPRTKLINWINKHCGENI